MRKILALCMCFFLTTGCETALKCRFSKPRESGIIKAVDTQEDKIKVDEDQGVEGFSDIDILKKYLSSEVSTVQDVKTDGTYQVCPDGCMGYIPSSKVHVYMILI